MVSSVSPLSQALKLLRVELQDARAAGPGTRSGVPLAEHPAGSSSAATALRSLPAKLRAVRARDGRLAPAKALRLFVEAAMLDELGATLQLDPSFGAWVERTCLAIEQDTESATLVSEAIQELDHWVA